MKIPKKTLMIGCALTIMLIIAIICIFKGEPKDRVKNIYEKINNSKNFTFTMEETTTEINYRVSMAQRGTDVSIDMYSGDEHNTTLVLENEAYYIMHNDKEYYNYGDEKVDSDIIVSSLKNISKNEYLSGKEEINGATYYYEEFNNDNNDFIIFADINESSIVKTRFYFKGNTIYFIKNIIQNEDSEQEELIKTDLTYTVDELQFSIPEDYAEIAE